VTLSSFGWLIETADSTNQKDRQLWLRVVLLLQARFNVLLYLLPN
jgi:hypothetical protein